MRLALSNSLALLTVITALTMAGCSDERIDPAATVPDINTDHYFFHDQLIQIFNPETAESIEVGDYDEGDDQIINLDTNPDKQGYEYMVYARNGSVYLKAHEKGNAPALPLLSTEEHICSLHPRKSAISNNASNRLSIQDLYMTDVVVSPDENCNAMTSRYYEVDFSYLRPRDENEAPPSFLSPQWRETSSAFVLGTLLLNYRPVIATDPDTGDPVKWGHIGFNKRNSSVEFYNQEFKLKWQTSISSHGTIPRFFQASDHSLLVQSDQDIYIRNIPNLFVLGQKRDNTDNGLPSQSAIAKLFNVIDMPTEFSDADNPVEVESDGNNFAILDGSVLYYYDDDNDIGLLNNPVFTASGEIDDIDFSLLPNSPAQILIKTTDNQNGEELLLLTVSNLARTTLISAEDLQFHVMDEILYVNAFRGTGSSSWQAYRMTRPVQLESTWDTYELSMFAFTEDQRTQKMYPLLIQSDSYSEISGALVSPKVGPYSIGEITGLYSGNVFGVINNNIKTTNIKESPNRVINDTYGTLYTKDDSGLDQLHFFNLRKPENSLKLMF